MCKITKRTRCPRANCKFRDYQRRSENLQRSALWHLRVPVSHKQHPSSLSTTANYQRYFNLAIVLNLTDEWTDLVSCSGISGFKEITGVINQRELFSIILNWSNWKNFYRCSVQVYKKYEDTAIGPNSLSDCESLSLSLSLSLSRCSSSLVGGLVKRK